jgi:RNA polymerase sigma factor (sigma-70 family)
MTAPVTPAHPKDMENAYQFFRQPLLKKARRWFPSLRGAELDLYQSAWESLLRNRDGIRDVEKYLERALYNRGIDELRARALVPALSLDAAGGEGKINGADPRGKTGRAELHALVERTTPIPEEQAELREDAQLLAELLDELTPRQQQIIKLRWGWGIPRKQAARLLGISERVAKRELEDAAPLIAENVRLIRAGRWCEKKRSLILAYSFDLLSAKRAALAEQHLEGCRSCRRTVRALQTHLQDLAAVTPLPLLALEAPSVGHLTGLTEVVESARGGLTQLVAGAKQHTLAVLTRAPGSDAVATQVTASGGLRGSGSLAAAVMACLVAGGGATYCAVEGVPNAVRDVAGIERPQEHQGDQQPRPTAEQAPVTVPESPVATAPQPQGNSGQSGSGTQDPSTPDSAQQSESTPPASPAPAGAHEFGSASASSAPSSPAPAPSSGGGEFTP